MNERSRNRCGILSLNLQYVIFNILHDSARTDMKA